ncbi:MAG: hypothetical protein ABNH53_07360 [Henriciella sp.]|jgi:hypothetical protein
MYNNQQSGGISSNLVFGLIIVAVMAIILIGILIMPTNSGKSGSKIQVGDSVLLSELEDGATRKYILTLNRVSPHAGKRLEAKAIKAIANGDGKADLAILAMEAMDDELPAYLSSLKKADVKHFDAMLQLSERGLGQLRRSNSKWCKAGHYERFENLSPAEAEELVKGAFTYPSAGFAWGAELNTIFLEAVEDAKSNPKSYGKLQSSDERALQALAMKLMTHPSVKNLSKIKARNRQEAKRIMGNMDICGLAMTGIDAVQGLPKQTRGRLWATGLKEIDGNNLERQLRKLSAF